MFISFLVVRGMHIEFLDVSSVNSKCLIMTREGCAAPLARAQLAELMVIGRSKDSSALVFYHHHVSSRLAPTISRLQRIRDVGTLYLK